MYRALLICNSDYPEDPAGLPRLNGPRRDGLVMWRALCDPTVGMFLEQDIEVLYEGTSKEILASVSILLDDATSVDDVLIYFSGHAERISKDELVLCSRETRSHTPITLTATGVQSSSLSAMIDRSSAGTVTVILDCCFSGSFKGTAEAGFDGLKGDGRFVLASSSSVEPSKDSIRGYPSPFTQAVVRGLMFAADPSAPSAGIDLDFLYSIIESSVAPGGPRPYRGYDGSGKVIISKLQSRSFRPQAVPEISPAAPAATIRPQALSLPGASHEDHGDLWQRLARLGRGRRLIGDMSVADVWTWVFLSMLAVGSIPVLWYTYLHWPQVWVQVGSDVNNNMVQRNDPHRNIVWPCIVSVIAVFVLSMVEGYLAIQGARKAESRRELVQAIRGRTFSTVRLARQVASYVLLAAILTPIFGYQDYSVSWVAALSFFGIFGVTATMERLAYGDSLYFAGLLVYLVSVFLPVDMTGLSSGEVHYQGIGSGNIFELVLGSITMLAWWFKAPRGILLVGIIACFLPLLTEITESRSAFGVLVGIVGVIAGFIAWLLGTGRRLDADNPGLDW